VACFLLFVAICHAQRRIPIIFDIDIGDDIDALALALALQSPELDVRAVTVVDDTERRTRLAWAARITIAGYSSSNGRPSLCSIQSEQPARASSKYSHRKTARPPPHTVAPPISSSRRCWRRRKNSRWFR
jgi:hypothetical protein